MLILYEPLDQVQGGEKHLGSDGTVIGDDPPVELVRGVNHLELGDFHHDVDEPGKGPGDLEKDGCIRIYDPICGRK